MRYQKKVILSIIAHLCWLYIIIFSNFFNGIHSNEICDALLKPYMKLLIYPIIINFYVVLIYKVNPLEDEIEQKNYAMTTVIFTIICWIYVFSTHMHMNEYSQFI